MKQVLSLLLLLQLVFPSLSRPESELVREQIAGYTGHNWYSGYLNFDEGSFHYVLFDSQYDPSNDPLLLWLNGGPGCSSLIGMVYENGPFVFVPNTTTLELNPHAWNKRANLLYIESPQGVGFSEGTPERLDDRTVATYNLKALLSFFAKFPDLKGNSFYLSGQSYAGIYVPYLAYEILNHNDLPSSKQSQSVIKLQGILVGNACTDPRECYQSLLTEEYSMSMFQYEYLHRHAYFTDKQYQMVVRACMFGYFTQQCIKARAHLDQKFDDSRTNIMNIYAPCYYQATNQTRKLRQSGKLTKVGVDEGACDDSVGILQFFNRREIQEVLHVRPSHYSDCSESVARRYTILPNASYWIYPTLMRAGLRLWVYSGDADSDVPITGTLAWLGKLREEAGLPVVEPWRQWWVHGLTQHEDQVGGMVWGLRGLTFVSVRGAGHQVPRDKRRQSEVMLGCFLDGRLMPSKNV